MTKNQLQWQAINQLQWQMTTLINQLQWQMTTLQHFCQQATATLQSTMQSTTALLAVMYREKPKIGRKPTAIRNKVKSTKTKATKKVTQSGNEPIVRGRTVSAKHMKKIAKPSTRALAWASIRLASDHIEDHEQEQDPEQELDLVEKLAKAAMHKSKRKKL